MGKLTIDAYLRLARQLGIRPNFWLSREYLSIQDVSVEAEGGAFWIQEEDWTLFPPLPLSGEWGAPEYPLPQGMRIWSDFDNLALGDVINFLDWEYVYDSNRFQDLVGGGWATFRKNARKWERGKKWRYTYEPPPDDAITTLLTDWLAHRSQDESEPVEDHESLLWFVFQGSWRAFLFDRDRLVGVNVWDENEPYLIFRYCIAAPGEPFLDEFTRLLFYRSVPGRLVIDGGTLGHVGLEQFKDKLLPVRKRRVYSRIIK